MGAVPVTRSPHVRGSEQLSPLLGAGGCFFRVAADCCAAATRGEVSCASPDVRSHGGSLPRLQTRLTPPPCGLLQRNEVADVQRDRFVIGPPVPALSSATVAGSVIAPGDSAPIHEAASDFMDKSGAGAQDRPFNCIETPMGNAVGPA